MAMLSRTGLAASTSAPPSTWGLCLSLSSLLRALLLSPVAGDLSRVEHCGMKGTSTASSKKTVTRIHASFMAPPMSRYSWKDRELRPRGGAIWIARRQHVRLVPTWLGHHKDEGAPTNHDELHA